MTALGPTKKTDEDSERVKAAEDLRTASMFNSSENLHLGDRKCLTWMNIGATVPLKGKGRKKADSRKTVLNDVSGIAYPGEVLAIMGGSGAGKTTLMNILARLKSADVESTGQVFINGKVCSEKEMQMNSAYVQQVDLFVGSITVREQLVFSARLRMRDSTEEDRWTRINNVIRDMNLTDCQNTIIGIPGRCKGISIGEKKRLAFASEVLNDPPILFCDEPTSGLDSFMASQVVVALKSMAASGKTVITVIHQPSSQVFNMFDTVCFMSCGKPTYHGPVSQIIPFFSRLGDEYAVPESFNPADHIIALISVASETKDRDTERITYIRKTFEQSEFGKRLVQAVELKSSDKEGSTPGSTDGTKNETDYSYPASFWVQFSVLMKRAFLTTLRDPVLLRVRIFQIILTAIVISIVSWRSPLEGETIMNIEGVIYNVARDMNFLFLFPSINFIVSELPIFFREHKARIYSVEAYYLAKSTAEMPQYTVLPLFYAAVVYWCTGLNPGMRQFIVFCLMSILQVWVATSIAYAGACVFGEEGMAVTYMPVYIFPMLIFGGFYINYQNIPSYFRWLSHLSWFKYGFESMQINQWESIHEITGCPKPPAPLPLNCPAYDGLSILKKRGMTPDDFWKDVGMLVLFVFVYRIVGLLALNARARFQKSSA